MKETQGRLDLGVVLERRELDNPWIDHSWHAVAVVPGAAQLDPREPWIRMTAGEGWEQFHAGTLPMELFRRETEGYKVNLAQSLPRIFVVLRNCDGDSDCAHDLLPFLVTACPYEAQDYLDSGDELVEVVAMPETVVAFVKAYCEQHHVEEAFHKRKRKRHFDATASSPALRTGRGNGKDE